MIHNLTFPLIVSRMYATHFRPALKPSRVHHHNDIGSLPSIRHC